MNGCSDATGNDVIESSDESCMIIDEWDNRNSNDATESSDEICMIIDEWDNRTGNDTQNPSNQIRATKNSKTNPKKISGVINAKRKRNSRPESSDDVKIKQELLEVAEGGKITRQAKNVRYKKE